MILTKQDNNNCVVFVEYSNRRHNSCYLYRLCVHVSSSYSWRYNINFGVADSNFLVRNGMWIANDMTLLNPFISLETMCCHFFAGLLRACALCVIISFLGVSFDDWKPEFQSSETQGIIASTVWELAFRILCDDTTPVTVKLRSTSYK